MPPAKLPKLDPATLRYAARVLDRTRRMLHREQKRLRAEQTQANTGHTNWTVERLIGNQRGLEQGANLLRSRATREEKRNAH